MDELKRLHTEDYQLFVQVFENLDDLLNISIKERLLKEYGDGSLDLDMEIQREIQDLGMGMDMDKDLNVNDDNIISNLEKLVQIRRMDLITSMSNEKELDEALVMERDVLLKKRLEALNEKQLDDIPLTTNIDAIRNKILSSVNKDQFEDEEPREKYNKMVIKNIMLSQFVNDLINSITSVDLSNDETLLNILLECNNYSNYDLL